MHHSKGKRYSENEKAQILSYVQEVNDQLGRGGITKASEKFGVSPISISRWLQQVSQKQPSNKVTNILRRMQKLHETIRVQEAELEELRKRYAKLRNKL